MLGIRRAAAATDCFPVLTWYDFWWDDEGDPGDYNKESTG